VKETDAKESWEITPAPVKSKIVKLPDQAAAAIRAVLTKGW